MKIKAESFIRWALKHADRGSIPKGAELPIPTDECGTEPWHYLFGTIKNHTTPSKIAERWENFYSRKGWLPEQYKCATKNMRPTDYATDCAGLLDAFLSEKIGRTDKNSNIYYEECEEKGRIGSIARPYVLGEPVFMAGKSGRMRHIGYICGFLADEPLVIEARGLSYGVIITKFSEREWTHRGLLTKYFIYDGGSGNTEENTGGNTEGNTEENTEENAEGNTPVLFEHRSPMMHGKDVKALQIMLNEAGYCDADGNMLAADGKLGRKSYEAFKKFITAHSALSGAVSFPMMPDEISVKQ